MGGPVRLSIRMGVAPSLQRRAHVYHKSGVDFNRFLDKSSTTLTVGDGARPLSTSYPSYRSRTAHDRPLQDQARHRWRG